MTRLPPYTDEPARTEAVIAEVRRTIHMHLHNTRRRKRVDGDVDLLTAAEGIEARWAELNPQSATDAARITAPDEAAAATPKPTAASYIGIDLARGPDMHVEMLMQGDKVIGWREGQTPSFSPSFLSHVKQNGGLADCATLCGVSLDWFTRKLDVLLTAPYSFPAPVTETGQRRWKLIDVQTWADTPAASFALARARKAHSKTLEKRT